MRRRILMVWVAAAIPVATACGRSSSDSAPNAANVAQAGAPGNSNKAADEAAIRAIYQKIPAQWMAAETAPVAGLFLPDGIEMMPGTAPTQGPAAVGKQLVALLGSMKNLDLSIGESVVTVADAGDMAVIKAPYRMTFTDAKGKKNEDHGTTMTVFRKVNGQWKILYDTNISEVAPQ